MLVKAICIPGTPRVVATIVALMVVAIGINSIFLPSRKAGLGRAEGRLGLRQERVWNIRYVASRVNKRSARSGRAKFWDQSLRSTHTAGEVGKKPRDNNHAIPEFFVRQLQLSLPD